MQRNNTLNILKGLACFAVVMLHCGFPGVVGKSIYGIARFAVPLFFAISGYFVYNENYEIVSKRLPHKIRHIWLLFLSTEFIYLIWHVVQYSIESGSIEGSITWITSWFSIKNLVRFIIFQTTVIGDVSWFLVALMMCYLTTFLLAKKNLWRETFRLIPILLCINMFLGELVPFMGIDVQWYWCSNFWLLGFPCYAIGYYIKANEEKLKFQLTNKKIMLILMVSIFLNFIERIATNASQLFISNIPFMICCFIYCLKYPNKFSESKIFFRISQAGDNLAFGVYILHPIVRDILRLFAGYIGIIDNIIWRWCLPVMVFAISALIYDLWYRLRLYR